MTLSKIVRSKTGGIAIQTPYSAQYVAELHTIRSARWNRPWWIIDADDETAAVAIARRHFPDILDMRTGDYYIRYSVYWPEDEYPGYHNRLAGPFQVPADAQREIDAVLNDRDSLVSTQALSPLAGRDYVHVQGIIHARDAAPWLAARRPTAGIPSRAANIQR